MLDSFYLSVYEWCQKQQGIQRIYGKLLGPKQLAFLFIVEDIYDYSTTTLEVANYSHRFSPASDSPQLIISCLHETKGYAILQFVQEGKELDSSWVMLANTDVNTPKTRLDYGHWILSYNTLQRSKHDLTSFEIDEFYLNLYHLRMLEDVHAFHGAKQLEQVLIIPFINQLDLTASEKHVILVASQDYLPQNSHHRLITYLTIFEQYYPQADDNAYLQTCRAFITRIS